MIGDNGVEDLKIEIAEDMGWTALKELQMREWHGEEHGALARLLEQRHYLKAPLPLHRQLCQVVTYQGRRWR